MRTTLLLMALVAAVPCHADAVRQTKGDFYDAFRQLDGEWPAANVYRTASGAPGPEYWQQRADYDVEVTLDEAERRISASETITYTNNSPDVLRYLWVQLDQNRFREDSLEQRSQTASEAAGRSTWEEKQPKDVLTYFEMARRQNLEDVGPGFEIERVADARGRELPYTVVDTMMRVDLPEPLQAGKRLRFSIDWSFNLVHSSRANARGGYEHFPDSDTYIYLLAQWFPRMAAYTDYGGWRHKAFLNIGEFTLEFGDYEVAITVPEDHIVAATGELQNPRAVLSGAQRQRLAAARDADSPVFIVTPEEALENEREQDGGTKTWEFRAGNVRDFAWASSRKFAWDAMVHRQPGGEPEEVLAMSFYPNEGEPNWSRYSTHAVVHTMDVYSRFTFPYPYPVAQSVNTWESSGMEYPMITFNGYRPEPFEGGEDTVEDPPEKTWSRQKKHALIGVIIHEIGHIYFPMIVNSDEREWTWMDEGINSFLDYTAALEWEEDFRWQPEYPHVLEYITDYMTSEDQVPVMTHSDSVRNLGPNAYTKPTAALLVLRETILGRERFDAAFREYARRWKFKRPTPADFFRTMEDASGTDLDWFWRGWFYSTDHVDVALANVREYRVSTGNPEVEFELDRREHEAEVPEPLTQVRNRDEGRRTYMQRHPELEDFYNEYHRFTVSNSDRNDYREMLEGLEDWEYEALERAVAEDDFVYFLDFENRGGLPTPLPLEIGYADGSEEFLLLPAEIWRRDQDAVTKLLIRDKAIASVALDPRHETADADYSNNDFPRSIDRSRIELHKSEDDTRNLMKDMLETLTDTGTRDDGDRRMPLEPGDAR